MRICFQQLLVYGFVGLGNTCVHGVAFAILVKLGMEQSFSNFIAFLIAVTFSFYANAFFTFKKQPTLQRFLKLSSFMAVLSYLGGWVGDYFELHFLQTFILWSLFSFIVGFIFSKLVVFNQ